MAFDSKIQIIRDYYGIRTFRQWAELYPREILALPGVGQATLDHVRLYLAQHGVTLKDDQTPEFWQDNPRGVRIVQQVTEDEDDSIVCPFKVLIDSNEQQPFAFVGIRSDADQRYRPMIVRTEWRSLGRHPNQLGDYSIDGLVGRVHVERKSIADCQGTLLDFRRGGGRERFQQELSNLSKIDAALVVVEGTVAAVLGRKNDQRKKDHREVAKGLFRSILALQQDFKVPWFFANDRRMAEIATFRFLERFWKKDGTRHKETKTLLAEL